MSRQATLTRHAISPPAFEGSKVHRERLVDALHANIPRRLVAVIAPAGYGKTTLLADFANHTELPICWLRLTEGDRDPMRMAGVLQASLASRFRRLRRTLRVAAMAGADEVAVAMAFAHAIRSAVEEPFVLIVDDVHLVNDSASVMGFWKTFLDHQPEQVTLMMAGREVPNVPMDGLLERGQVAGLGPLELALTRDETRELSRRTFGKDLREDDLERLQRETGGWVMGVLLSGAVPVSGLGVLVQSQRPMVYDYLAAVVLNRQPRALREFLLHSAVLPVMTAEACDEVLRRGESGRMLLQAMRGGMFVTSTGERPKTYEYHPQFREFLLATLQEEDAADLHRLRVQAGAYLARQGSIEAAVDLYLEAGDTKRAGRLAEKHARAIRRAGKLETLERWRERLIQVLRVRAQLEIQVGIGLADRGLLAKANERFRQAERTSSTLSDLRLRTHATLGMAQVACLAGDYAVALASANRALRLSSGSAKQYRSDAMRFKAIALSFMKWKDPRAMRMIEGAVRLERRRRKRDPYALTIFLFDLAEVADRAGLRERAIEARRSLSEFAQSKEVLALQANVMWSLAIADVFEGELMEAYRKAEVGAHAAKLTANPRMMIVLCWLQAILLAVAGNTDNALNLLNEVEAHSRADVNQWLRWPILTLRCDILRWDGRKGQASDEVARWRLLFEGGHLAPWAAIRVMAVELVNDPRELAASLERLLNEERSKCQPDDLALAHWLIARAHWCTGSPAQFRRHFRLSTENAFSPLIRFSLCAEMCKSTPALRRMLDVIAEGEKDTTLARYVGLFGQMTSDMKMAGVLDSASDLLSVQALASSVQVSANGRVITLRPLDEELLILLVEAGNGSRETLCDALWPGRPRASQAANLHSAIYRLRNALGPGWIRTSEIGYCIAKRITVQYDAAEFTEAASRLRSTGISDVETRLELCRSTLGLYGDGFLSRSGAVWVQNRRAYLERTYLFLVERFASDCLIAGRADDADEYLARALALDPYSDGLNMARFEQFARGGKWRSLSAAYAEYVRDLREALGIDPPKIVRELYGHLIAGIVE